MSAKDDLRRLREAVERADETLYAIAKAHPRLITPAVTAAYTAYRADLHQLEALLMWQAAGAGMSADDLRARVKAGLSAADIRAELPSFAAVQSMKYAKLRAKNRSSARRARERETARAAALDRGITAAARAYRAKHSYDRRHHSTRALAAHVARKIDRPVNTVRRRLTALKIR